MSLFNSMRFADFLSFPLLLQSSHSSLLLLAAFLLSTQSVRPFIEINLFKLWARAKTMGNGGNKKQSCMVSRRFFCHCICVEKYQPKPDPFAHMHTLPFLYENELQQIAALTKNYELKDNKKQNYIVKLWFACLTMFVLSERPQVCPSLSQHLFLLLLRLAPALTHSPWQSPRSGVRRSTKSKFFNQISHLNKVKAASESPWSTILLDLHHVCLYWKVNHWSLIVRAVHDCCVFVHEWF